MAGEVMENQLKWLMDYTLFHIGAYITLSTLLVGLLGLEGFKQRVSTMKPFLMTTLFLFIVAGLCGGVVASSIPYFATFNDFKVALIGPSIGIFMWPLETWTMIEHLAFWVGVAIAFVGVVRTAFLHGKRRLTAADVADMARRLGKECYDASSMAPQKYLTAFKTTYDGLQTLAADAEKDDAADESRHG
jgi:ABC-type multidrug transport system fused ATPase/permease subunit